MGDIFVVYVQQIGPVGVDDNFKRVQIARRKRMRHSKLLFARDNDLAVQRRRLHQYVVVEQLYGRVVVLTVAVHCDFNVELFVERYMIIGQRYVENLHVVVIVFGRDERDVDAGALRLYRSYDVRGSAIGLFTIGDEHYLRRFAVCEQVFCIFQCRRYIRCRNVRRFGAEILIVHLVHVVVEGRNVLLIQTERHNSHAEVVVAAIVQHCSDKVVAVVRGLLFGFGIVDQQNNFVFAVRHLITERKSGKQRNRQRHNCAIKNNRGYAVTVSSVSFGKSEIRYKRKRKSRYQ